MERFEASIPLPDGAVLHAMVEGAGPDILLVTGLGGTAAFWDPVARELARRFRVMRFDQRGIGRSRRGEATSTIAQLAADSAAVLDRFESEAAIIVGHSTGGCIAQELGLDHASRVRGLGLTGAWARPNRYFVELFRARLALLEPMPREYAAFGALLGYPPEWVEQNFERYQAILGQAPLSPETQGVLRERIGALTTFDRSAELARIRAPIAVIGAEDDLIVPAFMQRGLAALLPACELVMLPGGGHFFPVTRTAEFVGAIERWCDTAVR